MHLNVGCIHGPDLIRAVGTANKIDAMCLVTTADVGRAVDGLDAELLHRCVDMLAADFVAFQLEHVAQHPYSGQGIILMKRIDSPHQPQIALPLGLGKSARKREQLNLPDRRKIKILVDHRFALASPM